MAPTGIHDRCGIVLGSKEDVMDVVHCYEKHNSTNK